MFGGVVSYVTWKAGGPIEATLSAISLTVLGCAIVAGRLYARASARLPRMWVRRR